MLDFENAFAAEIESLRPDVVHAHDFVSIAIVGGAVRRLRAQGAATKWLYDAHEYVPGIPVYTDEVLKAYCDMEADWIREADAVLTVGPRLSERLQARHDLCNPPSVVLNCPLSHCDSEVVTCSVRHSIALEDDVPLLVFSGGVTRERSVDTVIRALPSLPGYHFVMVVAEQHALIRELLDLAHELGVADRVHTAAYVRQADLTQYLSSATMAIHTLTHCENHEVALPNKLFEYLHAGLPMVVSDVQAMSEFVAANQLGASFVAEDPDSLAGAIQSVMHRYDLYKKAALDIPLRETYSWENQTRELIRVYGELVGQQLPPADRRTLVTQLDSFDAYEPASSQPHPQQVSRRRGRPTLLIGPRNTAGQANSWAASVRSAEPAAHVETLSINRASTLQRDGQRIVDPEEWSSDAWRRQWRDHVFSSVTHVAFEAGQAILGGDSDSRFDTDLDELHRHGIQTALIFHGSELRNPRLHAQLEPDSPFGDENDSWVRELQREVDRLKPHITRFAGPVFVTTNDLKDYAPHAHWLPVVVRTEDWLGGRPVLERSRPIVVAGPTHRRLKGGDIMQEVCTKLDDEGLIEYRALTAVDHSAVASFLLDADIVLDQFLIGDYGVFACEAMAAQRVVIGHVADRVLARLPGVPPIVPSTSSQLETTIRRVIEDRTLYRGRAQAGLEYVVRWHSGHYSAQQLAKFFP
jgi:glycosyltransferase involved in cell wall biosynthesis